MDQPASSRFATSERRVRRITTILFMAIAGAAILFIYIASLPSPSLEPPGTASPTPHSAAPTTSERARGFISPATGTTAASSKLAAEALALQRTLPQEGSKAMTEIRQRLQHLATQLPQSQLTPDAEQQVRSYLADIAVSVEDYQNVSSMPEVQSGELEAELDAMVRTLLDEQQSERADVVRRSKQVVRDEYETLMRPLRLSTRDLQDEAIAIRGRIEQAQREQAEALAAEEREESVNADMTDIRRFLSPFINSGHVQPKVGANKWTTERTIDSKPVSLSRLKASGALDKTLEGLERLFIFGGGKNPALHNRRPLGDFPEYSSEQLRKPEIQASVQRAQELLIKHGDGLVEMKLLSP